jgi:hypothetical protein
VLAIEGHVTRDGRGTVGWGQDRRGVNTKTRHPAEHRVPYTLTAAKEALIFVRSKDRASTRGDILREAYRHVSGIHRGTMALFLCRESSYRRESPDLARVTDQGFRDPITSAVRSLVMQEYKGYKIKCNSYDFT